MDLSSFHGIELPDPDALQKLANEYFRAISNPDGTEALPALSDVSLYPERDRQPKSWTGKDQADLMSKTEHYPGAGYIPKSVAGSGISPSAIGQNHSFNISEPQTSLPDPHFAGEGKIPSSVAGSGISPSVSGQNTLFAISAPQTSLPDPHFGSIGQAPGSMPTGGPSTTGPKATELVGNHVLSQFTAPVQPTAGFDSSYANPVQDSLGTPYSIGYLPFAARLPFESELNDVFRSINIPYPSAQLPGMGADAAFSSFYFLSNSDHFTALKVPKTWPTNQSTQGYGASGVPKIPFDVNRVKQDFPILQERVNGRQIIWLDNAATTQKPKSVIHRVSYFYEHENSNIHRAAHHLAGRATDAYEMARKKVQVFLNAASVNEIIFVRGSTEAINLVAKSWGEQNLGEGDEIIISYLEHHANIVPWQQLSAKKGVQVKVIPVDDDGQVIIEEYAKLLSTRTKLVSFTQVSNALGTVTPAKKLVEMAHQIGAKVLVDGAQAVSHMRADVSYLDCDWYVFSGHKVFGPTGIGVLYGKEELLNETQPWQGGGNMIADVTFEKTKYQQAPSRFEAGTGNIADAVGLGAAIDYVNSIGIELISQYEHYLLLYATNLMKQIPGLRLIGTAADKAGVLSFVLQGYKTEQVGAALNEYGIAVRSGHHCAQPILRRFGVESTVRPSLALYNTCADIDALIVVLDRLTSHSRAASRL